MTTQNTLVQIAQRAEDLARATRFYAMLLERDALATFDPPGLAFFDLGGTRLLLDTGAPSCLFYVRVGDLDGAMARLRAAGVEVVSEPHVIFSHEDSTLGPEGTDEWMAFVKDSEGNAVGLVEQRPRG